MENKNNKVAVERIDGEIKKLKEKDFTFFFFVIDTKGKPSGSLAYIYETAKGLSDMGYNVAMIHNEEEFIGVRDWLGDEYADMKHLDAGKENVKMGPSDFIIIPDIFSNVMTQTKKMPCKRVALLQNFDYMTSIIPFGVTWPDMGITDVITTSAKKAERVKSYFPGSEVSIVRPSISSEFADTGRPKDMVINIVCGDERAINQIAKPFFWQYPTYRWVPFRNLAGLSRKEFAEQLGNSAITLWLDDDCGFGYSALEAMKSGSVVIGKIPEDIPEWMEKDGTLVDSGIWYRSYEEVPKILASVIRTWMMGEMPESIEKLSKEAVSGYTKANQLSDIKKVYAEGLVGRRISEFESIKEKIENNNVKVKEE